MKERNPMISVILTTYNRAHLLTRAIRSVQQNGYDNFELVIVDDCSADSTEEVVTQIQNERIVYIKLPKNMGVLAARNKGLDLAKGKYITTLDDDDVLMNGVLELVVSEFEKRLPHGVKILWFDCVDAESGTKSGFGMEGEGPVRYEDYVCGRLRGDFWLAFEKSVFKGKRFNPKLWGYESLLWLELHRNFKAYYIPKVACKKFRRHGKRMCDIENQIKYIPQIKLAYEEFLQKFGQDTKRLCPKLFGRRVAYLGLHCLLTGDFKTGRKYILQSMIYSFSVKYLGLFFVSFILNKRRISELYKRWLLRGSQNQSSLMG